MKKKKWVVSEKFSEDIISQLLYNRGLKDKNAVANFFNPPSPEVIASQYPNYLKKISTSQVEKAANLVKEAVDTNHSIIVYGDFDADGLCGTAILYQTLKDLGANVTPFIPDRVEHGYGLSIKALKKIQQLVTSPLLITTDCGIGAVDEIKYAKSLGFNIIITDHHSKGQFLPEADAIVWTDELAGAGVAYLFASRLANEFTAHSSQLTANLDLVALATIADVQPLTGVNRALVKQGLVELNKTSRAGLKELIKASGLEEKELGTYAVGWMLGPRLNASGRLGNASDSLKLLLTEDANEAQEIAATLNQINSERQQLTQKTVEEARAQVNPDDAVIVIYNKVWHEGIVGLVAGRLKEEFYRPTVVIGGSGAVGKGSARSISGFDIKEALDQCQEFLLTSGGHAMAAGLSVNPEKIGQLQEKLNNIAKEQLTEEDLIPTLKIDVAMTLNQLAWDLAENLKKFEPFGMGNPKPTFLTKSVRISTIRTVGSTGRHLKLQLRDMDDVTGQPLQHWPCIGFGLGEWEAKLCSGDLIDIVYSLEENHWNGQTTLQLKLKDLQKSEY